MTNIKKKCMPSLPVTLLGLVQFEITYDDDYDDDDSNNSHKEQYIMPRWPCGVNTRITTSNPALDTDILMCSSAL